MERHKALFTMGWHPQAHRSSISRADPVSRFSIPSNAKQAAGPDRENRMLAVRWHMYKASVTKVVTPRGELAVCIEFLGSSQVPSMREADKQEP